MEENKIITDKERMELRKWAVEQIVMAISGQCTLTYELHEAISVHAEWLAYFVETGKMRDDLK